MSAPGPAAGRGDAADLHGAWLGHFGGVRATVLTDNMKTVVVDRIDDQPRLDPKDAGLRQLLPLRAMGLPSLSTPDKGQDRVGCFGLSGRASGRS